MNLWEDRARLEVVSVLQKVLDPADTKGIKNAYIDYYLKYYLKAYLRPDKNDIILEIGSGVGRLVEYLSCVVKKAYGIDLIDKFIDDCNNNILKHENTSYYKISEVNTLSSMGITKAYIVWVLMYFSKDEDVVATLLGYNRRLTANHSMCVIEQVKKRDETEHLTGAFYCKYRTIENYRKLFEESGYSVEECVILGERRLGFFARMLFNKVRIYRKLPGILRFFMPILFLCDKRLLNIRRHVRNLSCIAPTDVLFVLKAG